MQIMQTSRVQSCAGDTQIMSTRPKLDWFRSAATKTGSGKTEIIGLANAGNLPLVGQSQGCNELERPDRTIRSVSYDKPDRHSVAASDGIPQSTTGQIDRSIRVAPVQPHQY